MKQNYSSSPELFPVKKEDSHDYEAVGKNIKTRTHL